MLGDATVYKTLVEHMGDYHVLSKWFMRLAMDAAPKPLSMLTTETPIAQLFSIDRSAVTPPKLAP